MRTHACAALLLSAAACAQAGDFHNVTAGGKLRHGVYGRIEVRGTAAPPVIYKDPVVADLADGVPGSKPVYLYVPPGQVRKWPQHCHKWKACDQPVLFVRMDNSPSRLGKWKQRVVADASREPPEAPASRSFLP